MNTHRTHPDLLRNRPVRIAVVGAGGNGSQILNGLARLHTALLGVGREQGISVTVYDPDHVTPSNVGRQLFSPADVDQLKAAVLVNRLNLFYGLEWHAVPALFGQLKTNTVSPDILVSCVDTAASRRLIHRQLSKETIYWLDLGNKANTGQVILGEIKNRGNKLNPLRLPTVTELFPELLNPKIPEDNTPSCSLAGALEKQDLFINQAVSTFALNLLWRLLRHGEVDHHGAFINLHSARVTPLPIDPESWKRMGYKQHTYPLRKIKRTIEKKKHLFSRNLVLLDCGHKVRSNGLHRARCTECI